MSRKFIIVAALVIVAATVAGGVRSRASRRHAANANSTQASSEKYEADKIEADYGEAISAVEEKYAGEIDYEKATQAAIQGMLFTLDPHSVYFPANEFKKLKEDQSSSFYGIGVQIQRHEDGVYVQSVVDSTPASRAGLRYGDRIVEVDGKDARDWSSEEVSKARGRENRTSRSTISHENFVEKRKSDGQHPPQSDRRMLRLFFKVLVERGRHPLLRS